LVQYWFNHDCPVCGQGRLFVERRSDNGRLVLLCEECYSVWDGPASVSAHHEPGSEIELDLGYVSRRDIDAAGWGEFRFQEAKDDRITLTTSKISCSDAEFVRGPSAGGVAVFLGCTRTERAADGRDLVALDYEAYESMALKQLHDLAAQARQRWPIEQVVILHRTGRVALGEPSVLIAVSTPHRGDAFDACR
jgi:molybdopterin synthase catalytic subunit